MQGQTVPGEIREEAYNLEKDWKQLVIDAKKRDFKLAQVKKNFAT